MRVVGYVRVSTDEQATGGVSLAAQSERVRAYCGLYALALVELVEDPGQSAKTLRRPGLARCRALLDGGTVDGLVVAKLDRLTRSVAGLAELLSAHFDETAGRQLFSVADSIDTRTAGGRLVLNVLTSVAQWEREAVVERTREAVRHKRGRGEVLGHAPTGYRLDPAGPCNARGRPVRLVEDPAEQRTVRLIGSLAADGLGPRWIARYLTALGVPTKRGRGPWCHQSVARVLARTKPRSGEKVS